MVRLILKANWNEIARDQLTQVTGDVGPRAESQGVVDRPLLLMPARSAFPSPLRSPTKLAQLTGDVGPGFVGESVVDSVAAVDSGEIGGAVTVHILKGGR